MVQSTGIKPISSKVTSDIDNGVKVISGLRKNLIEMRIRKRILQLVMQHMRNPIQIIRILKELDRRRRMVLGDHPISKLVRVGRVYHWDLYTPGYPSVAFDKWLLSELNRIQPIPQKTNVFNNVFFAITKKCSLKCEHCFEWDILNQKETLSTKDLHSIQKRIEQAGAAQIQLTGGEPILRASEIGKLLNTSNQNTEYWILTSGHKFDSEVAANLKEQGLHGIMVSVDHHNAEEHNRFRGNPKSFEWARKAIEAGNNAGLFTGLTICVSREYIVQGNLDAYMELAKSWKVAFVQLLEPKAVGHYSGKDVVLTKKHTDILDEIYLKYNSVRSYNSFPIITYHGYHQRRAGCFAAGNRNLYIDTDGDVNACPFCKSKKGNILVDGIEHLTAGLQQQGCSAFGKTNF